MALATTGLALGGLVACNQILGTDKFSDGDPLVPDSSTGEASTTDASQIDSGSTDASKDVQVIILPTGAQPSTWAHWRMPDSLNLFPDGGPANGGATPSYAKVTDAGLEGGAVADLVTKLTWSATLPSVDTFEEARDACKNKLGSGWRLPTRIELVSILDHSVKDNKTATPRIDPIFDSKNGFYWTSSPVQPLTKPLVFWKVNFTATTDMNGIAPPFSNTSAGGYVRCVLGT